MGSNKSSTKTDEIDQNKIKDRRNNCPFCKYEGKWKDSNLSDRIFYKNEYWFAFLAAPFHTVGHTILAATMINSKCPNDENLGLVRINSKDFTDAPSLHYSYLGKSLGKVSLVLREHYADIDSILYTSVRGDIKHFHFHMIPLRKRDEVGWREKTGHENGALLQYLGDLEKNGDENAQRERIVHDWSKTEQREILTKSLIKDVAELRVISGYKN
jgi:diadenosine tetraphosphate (Ap4A) HIT family hydrolase